MNPPASAALVGVRWRTAVALTITAPSSWNVCRPRTGMAPALAGAMMQAASAKVQRTMARLRTRPPAPRTRSHRVRKATAGGPECGAAHIRSCEHDRFGIAAPPRQPALAMAGTRALPRGDVACSIS